MYPTIIAAIDESTDPAVARMAGELARELGSTLVVAHVVDDPPLAESLADRERDRHAGLRRGRENLHWVPRELPADVEVRERVTLGPPAEELVAIAGEEEAELLIVGSRGRGAVSSALLGSVSRTLAREAPCPVVILTRDAVEARSEPGAASPSVVVGLDGSDRSVEAARLGADLASRLESRLVLVHALDAPAGVAGGTEMEAADALERVLASIAVDGEIRVAWGPAAFALEEVAAEEDARLIVIGPRDIGAWRAAALGSVTSELLRESRHPVVLLPERVSRGIGSLEGESERVA